MSDGGSPLYGSEVLDALEPILGDALKAWAECPMCRVNSTVRYIVQHLNDEHYWTREDIADWLDGTPAMQ